MSQFLRRMRKDPYLLTGTILTGFICLLVLWGLICSPYDPTEMDATARLAGASSAHLLGTDHLGRDVLSRILYATRVTLWIALGTVGVGAGCGTILGALTGYYGGLLDETLMRIIDVLFAFPSILLALVFVSLFGAGTSQVVLALGIAFIPSFARVVRGEFLRCLVQPYVEVARLQGVKHMRIIFVHILPNILPMLFSSILIGFNNAVLAEAGLSFLGIGSQPPYSSLGRMLSESQAYLFNRPGMVLAVGFVIVVMNLGFAFLGEGIKRWAK